MTRFQATNTYSMTLSLEQGAPLQYKVGASEY
jgi:hypothetical protein